MSNDRFLVTGGSGYVGRHLIAKLLKHYPSATITSLSRSEGNISKLLMECTSDRLKIAMVDVVDYSSVQYWTRNQDVVFHLSAMKRIDLAEEHSAETIGINVMGTLNLLGGFTGKTFVLMSSDKAVEPSGCYGATKLLAEKLVLEAGRTNNKARYVIVRGGNIIGSTGSVIEIWKNQIKQRNEITITDGKMQRYFTTVGEITDMLIDLLEPGRMGTFYFCPQGSPIVIGDLAKAVIARYGNSETKFKITGLRPGERISEKMLSGTETWPIFGCGRNLTIDQLLDGVED